MSARVDCLRDRTSIITGGAGGIGLATALRLARAGSPVALVDLDPQRVREATETVETAVPGAAAIGLALDVRRPSDMEAMASRVRAQWGRIDILVAAAGILRGVSGRPQTLADSTPEAWDAVIETNLTGMFLANRAVLPSMLERCSGDIVNVSSTSGRRGLAYDSAYCASKFGVIGLSESLADEVRPHGVRVQVVLPEVVDTPMLQQNGPLPRPSETLPADRVAGLIVHLLGLPVDMVLMSPIIAPFRGGRRAPVARP